MKVPTNWGEVTLEKYLKVIEVDAVDMDAMDKKVKILSILTGETEDAITWLSLPDFKRAISAIKFLDTLDCPEGVPTTVVLNGETFTINNDLNKLRGGEFISLSEWTKEKDKINSNIPDILSILLKPSGKKYYYLNAKKEKVQTLESLERNKALALKYLTMDKVIQLSGFFLRSLMSLRTASQAYSRKEMNKTWNILKRVRRDLSKHGVGSSR